MGSEIATFSSVYSDENSVPFAFTSPLYETMLVDDGSLHRYIIPTRHHMGVSEPFSGNPSGDVVFNIIDFDAHNFFRAACKKLGKFFFLHLYASSDISASNKKLTYRFKVEAVFTSHNHSSVTPIRLVNTSEIVVNVIAMHENCPIFTRSFHHFDVPENISIQQSIGKLSTSSSGSSVSAQNLFYIDPVELDIPFRVDLYSGDIFPTRPLNSQYARIGYPEFIHGKSEIELFETSNYTFNVYVASRGGSNRVRCNMVIAARVEISITKFRHSDLSIKVEHLEEITIPGAAGVAYARVYVVGSPSSVGSAIGLRISEPDMREKFELVSTSGKNEWLVQAKYDIHSISLNSWMVITLEAYEIPKVLTKGNENLNVFTSRLSRVKVNIPLVFKSKYKLSLPPEIKIRLSEAAIVNSTIEVLKPSAIFNMTNASFVFTDLRNQHQKSESKEKIRLTKSGSLVVVQPLDLENDISVQNALQAPVNNVIAIPFTVVDGNNLLLSSASESSIIVEVFDINDLDPVVQNNGSVHEVPENVSLNTHVLSVIGYDPDVSHTDLSYVLYDADILPFALIGPRNDELVVSKPLDAETMPTEFIVRILVSDSGIPLPRSVLAVYIIRILDINEHSPVFVEDSCEISLPVTDEGSIFLKAAPSSPSLNIGRYFAEDLDRDGQSSVTIHIAASSFPRPCFKIEEQTGDLNVVCSYLGSPGAQIILNLLASDGIKVSKESCTLSLNLVPFQEVAGTNFTRRCKSSHVYDKLQALKIQKKRYEFLLSQNTVYEPQFNRHRPQFPTDLPTRIHIPENLPIGTVILRFAASDEDGPDYSMAGQIIYGLEALRSVSSETEAATYVTDVDIKQAFLLLPNSGLHKEFVNNTAFCCGVSLVVAAPLDREVISSYSLILHACDLGQPQLCTFSPLHIFLDDLDDNAPEFLNPSVQQSSNVFHISTNPSLPTSLSQDRASGTISVPEDAQPDTILGQVRAVDRDVTSEVRYHLLNFQDVFKIHSRTGKIRLKTKLDRETQAVYELLVSAVGSPRGNHQQSQFKIPYFDFIQVSRAVDYDVRRSANTRVHIIVTDVNDNPPVFYSPGLPQEHQYLYSNSSGITDLNAWLGTDGYVVYVPEDIPEGAYITTLVATDRDEGMNALIRYSLFGKQERSTNCFHTDQMTGVVRLAAGCDLHKSSRSHVLTAWAMDHGASQLYANISFVVHVLSVKLNIFPPRFMVHPALFSGWIRENQPSGSFVFSKRDLTSKLQLKALDAEGSNVIFVIVGGSGFGLFGVNGDGTVRLTRSLDREMKNQYSLLIQATDGGGLMDFMKLDISVRDINDNRPIFAQDKYEVIPENLKVGTILATLNATDSDADPHNSVITYSIKFQNSNSFVVDTYKGTVTLNTSLDFELSQEHEIIVDAADPGGFSCSFNLKIVVLDINDNQPIFDTIEINAIPEDAPLGSLVGKINARDLDSVDTNRLVYSLAGAHDSSFSIESHTGLLRVSRPLDREVKSIHTLTVIVTDGSHQHSTAGEQSNSFTSSATFTIKLLDVNDSPPQFVNTSAHRIRISELAPIGERLTRLKAISQDEGDNAVIHYRLLTKQPEFGLNETTGDLWLQKPLDYEQTSAYFLTIEARDRGQPPLSSTAVLTVHVDDANDNQPQFLGRQRIPENIGLNNLDDLATVDSNFYEYYYAFSVVENSRNGTVVGKLNAIDPDSGDNGRVSFHLSGNIDFSNLFKTYHQDSENIEFLTVAEAKTRFSLDSESGRLILIFQPDREVVSGYWLVVQVEDHGKPNPLSSLTLVYIQILDINDCAPTFEKSNYEFYVEVDRSGNISACSEKQSSYENNCQSTSTGSSGNVLIGRLKLTDSDAHPNSGPFTCHLANSGIIQTTLHDSLSSSRSSATSLITSTTGSSSSTSLFSVRSTEMRIHTSNSNKNDHFNNQTDFSRGECLLYAIDKLPVGSQSLVIRVNDNGLTALHTTTTVTVRIIRMSNLPPEIVNTNSTLIYYRSLYDWNTNYFHESSSKQDMSEQISDKTICRITVKDRTAHDRLFFELLKDNTSMSNLFSVDQYDGTIRPAMKISSNPDTSRSNLYDTSTSRKPILNQFHNSLIYLDSGNYPLRVRVTNGTLTSEATMHIKVIAITEEMLDSSLVIRISNLLPNLFYMENYNTLLQNHLSNLLLKSSSSYFSPSSSTVLSPKNNSSQDENVYILSVQETDFPNRLNSLSSSPSIVYHRKNAFMNSHRNKRSIDRAVDILIAVYDPKEREFIKPSKIAQAISGIADSLSVEFGGEIEAVHDVCTPQFCPRGRCHTKVSIDPNGLMNRIEVHRVNQVSPRFVLSPVCQCPIHFTGLLCNTPTGACALANCPASRLCIPHGLNDYSCICPPPRTGPNCESLLIYGDGRDDCHSESCFNQRENGPLQFTGGTFIHWEFVNPNPFFMELKFSFRTRQTNGPLVFIRWSSLRAFQIRLTNGGHLVISATGLSNGLPITDWLVSDVSIADGHWHRVRFILTVLNSNKATHIDALFHDAIIEDSKMKSNSWNSNSDWWAELTVNGINPQSASINWIPGDSYQQGILVGADLVHGFRPLSEPYKLTTINTAPESNSFPNSTNATPIIFRSGFVGCFRDFTINHIKPPYQINLAPKHSESLRGFSSNPSVLIVRTHKLEYGCQPILTISGSCASGPCLHGGTCVTGSKQSSSSSSYVCDCPSLFHGRHCERTNDACLLAPCYNGGSCQALITSSISKTPAHSGLAAYRCICPAGLSGLHCEIVHPEIISQTSLLSKPLEKSGSTIQSGITCHTAQLILQQDVLNKIQSGTSSNFHSKELVCLHSGSCLDSSSGPQCICPSGWQGARCEYDVDECLCSPYSSGRGVCFNTPGSYKCNCSIGFSGQHCQSKNLIPLIPDTTILGLSQFHIYITVGLLAFLFLAALTTIVLLACRARGMIGGTLDGSRRSVKSVSSYWPNGGNQQTKPTSRLSDSRLNHLNHSAGGSLSGIPFVAASPAHLNHASHIGTHPRYHMISTSHRRPSLASSTFGYPVAMDESATALLNSNSGQMPFSSESVKLGGNCNAGATLADYADRDDSVSACNSGLVLYPTGVKDQMPVMMMLSPLPGAHGSVGPGNRASVIARYSPASSVVFYGPGVPSGSATPTNQIHSPQPGFCVDSSGSGYIPQHQCFTGSQVAVYPSGHPAFLPHPQSHQQLIQMVNMRPNSVVGSDRLSLGSGSDRFSAHSSQVLLQPNGTGPVPYPNCPQSQALTPQLYYHQPSTPQNQTWTPHLSNTGHNQPGLLIINQNHDDSNLEDACMTLKPQNTDTVKAVDVNKFQSSMKRQSTCDNQTPELTSNNNRKELNQRPVPASIQHTTSAFVLQGRQYSGRQQNNHAFNLLHAHYPCCPQSYPISDACFNQNSNHIFGIADRTPYTGYLFNNFHPFGIHQAIPVIQNTPILPFMFSRQSINLDTMSAYPPIPENASTTKMDILNSESLFHLPDSCPVLNDDDNTLLIRDSLGGYHQSSFSAIPNSKRQTLMSTPSRGFHHRPIPDRGIIGVASRRTRQPRGITKFGTIELPPPTSRPQSAYLLGLHVTSKSGDGYTANHKSEAHSSSGVRNTIVVETNGCINGSRVVGDPSPSTHLSNNFAKVESNNTISTSEHVNNSQNNKTNKDNGGAQDQIPNKLDWFGNGSGYHPLLPSNICNSLELNGNCKESQIRTNETSDTTVTPEISKKSLANGQTIIIPTTTKQQLSSSDVVNNLIQDTKHMAHIDDV
ncbi:putative cadherin [Schistosoma mansoni]|uniref:putative cadherin n=1 Tax=Schistosoma mansoni TaxID=6183 RepID=UPI00022DBFA5|nr:putative cadherin [Schistosoma mansoni]|eukprot:XP_018651928.1 putative cadherin [Schistosoma mansoni]